MAIEHIIGITIFGVAGLLILTGILDHLDEKARNKREREDLKPPQPEPKTQTMEIIRKGDHNLVPLGTLPPGTIFETNYGAIRMATDEMTEGAYPETKGVDPYYIKSIDTGNAPARCVVNLEDGELCIMCADTKVLPLHNAKLSI